MKNVTKDSVAMQIIHTPFHFSAIVLTGEQTLDPNAAQNTSALYLNSLHKNFKHQRRIPLRNVDSAIIRDMCRDHSDFVLSVPCIEQSAGSHDCGMLSLLNAAVALELGSLSAILSNGVASALTKYQLPSKDRWTTKDCVAAIDVLIRLYVLGTQSIPPLPEFLRQISTAIQQSREKERVRAEAEAEKKNAQSRKRRSKQTSLIAFLCKAKKNALSTDTSNK